MAYQRKPGACGLFVNDKHPEKSDLTGQIDIGCPACGHISTYWVNAWRKQTAAGMKWLSVQLREKLAGGRGVAPGERGPADDSDLDRAF